MNNSPVPQGQRNAPDAIVAFAASGLSTPVLRTLSILTGLVLAMLNSVSAALLSDSTHATPLWLWMVRFVGLAVLVWIPPAAFVLARVARVRRAGYDRDALVGWLVYSWYFPPESHTIPVPWRHRLGWAFLWPAAALIVLERLLVPVPGIDHAAVLYMTIPAVLLALVTSALGLRSGRLTDVALMAQARYWNYGKFPPLLFALVQRFGGPPQRSTLPAV